MTRIVIVNHLSFRMTVLIRRCDRDDETTHTQEYVCMYVCTHTIEPLPHRRPTRLSGVIKNISISCENRMSIRSVMSYL